MLPFRESVPLRPGCQFNITGFRVALVPESY